MKSGQSEVPYSHVGLNDFERQKLAAELFETDLPLEWVGMTCGLSTAVYRITHGDERFYLRILPEAESTFAPEAYVHKQALALGCRVPEVLHYEACNEVLGKSIMLTAEIPGDPLTASSDLAVARDIMKAAGRDLARINSMAVDGFGWIKRDSASVPGQLEATFQHLRDALELHHLGPIDSIQDDTIPDVPASQLRTAVNHACVILSGNRGSWLAHGDLDTSHIFVEDRTYSGMIDFGEIRGMPPFYDLGHHRMHDRERLPYSTLGWLLDGYREISTLPKDVHIQISAWSLLIAARALVRGIERGTDSQIVRTARRAIRREIDALDSLSG